MKKGEIWFVDLAEGQGHEQKGVRPCIILRKIYGVACLIPLTSSDTRAEMAFTEFIPQTPQNGLTQDSIALIFQITAATEEKLKRKIGELSQEQLEAIDNQLKEFFKIK
ncbi:MAG: type II toxin-antitoxin system PemK/MazF family toxin [Candidatus Diapherotrites archaeon]|nr:type II toxin-antitoxin system PemK/MazF family toxin [Candidatus Diapherotrites archaeon]